MITNDVTSISNEGRTVLPPQPIHPDPQARRRAAENEPDGAFSDQRKEEKPSPSNLDQEQLRHHVEQLEQKVSRITNRLGFSLDSGTLVLEVTERASGKVLHRFPPEELNSLGERLDETASLVIDLYA
jgi:uncharacterized FlaG/YvyC family protein